MNTSAEFRCRCGEVRGRVEIASPSNVNRVVCYCDDCQAFVHHLGRPDLLDAKGGSDLVQVAPASLRFDRGTECIVGVRLSPKGLFRWYSSCCKTPLGNTLTPSIPFVGMTAQVFGDSSRVDATFGKSTGAIYGKYAIGTAPKGSTGLQPLLLVRAIAKVLGWRVRGKSWPH